MQYYFRSPQPPLFGADSITPLEFTPREKGSIYIISLAYHRLGLQVYSDMPRNALRIDHTDRRALTCGHGRDLVINSSSIANSRYSPCYSLWRAHLTLSSAILKSLIRDR